MSEIVVCLAPMFSSSYVTHAPDRPHDPARGQPVSRYHHVWAVNNLHRTARSADCSRPAQRQMVRKTHRLAHAHLFALQMLENKEQMMAERLAPGRLLHLLCTNYQLADIRVGPRTIFHSRVTRQVVTSSIWSEGRTNSHLDRAPPTRYEI